VSTEGGQQPKITNRRGDVVLITYREYVLKDGNEVLLNEVKEPIAVVIGGPGLHPLVATELMTMKEGETRTVTIDGRPYFGVPDPANVVKVPKDVLTSMFGELKPGMTLTLGNRVGTIKEVGEDYITIDFNHPYAGLNIYSRVTLVKKLTDPSEKVSYLVKSVFGYYADVVKAQVTRSRITIAMSPDVLMVGDLSVRLGVLNMAIAMAVPNRTVTFVISPEVVSGRVPKFKKLCASELPNDGKGSN